MCVLSVRTNQTNIKIENGTKSNNSTANFLSQILVFKIVFCRISNSINLLNFEIVKSWKLLIFKLGRYEKFSKFYNFEKKSLKF